MMVVSRAKVAIAGGVIVLAIFVLRAALYSPEDRGPHGVADDAAMRTRNDAPASDVTPHRAADSRTADSRASAASRVTPAPFVQTSSDTLSVQIVDSTGEPREGVDVALVRIDGDPDFLLWRGRSGPDGIAVVPTWPKLRAKVAANAARSRDSTADDVAFLPLAPPPGQFFQAPFCSRAAPSEPVVATLPPTVDARIRVVDDKDMLVTSPVVVTYEAAIPRPPLGHEYDGIPIAREIVGGEARIILAAPAPEELPLQATSLVGAWLDVGSLNRPTIHGTPDHVFTIRLGPSSRRIVGRALLPDGTPLCRSRLRVRVEGASDWHINDSCATDGNGGFEIGATLSTGRETDDDLDLPLESAADSVASNTAVVALSAVDGQFSGSCARSLPQQFAPSVRVVDLGTVVFKVPQLIAAGRVVDLRGNPISGAEVLLARAPGSMPRPLPGERELWAITDSDGAFRILSATPMSGSVAIYARHAGYLLRRPLTTEVGAVDVLVTLVQNGHATWRSETPPCCAGALIFAEITTGRVRDVVLGRQRQGFVELAPGRYEVMIRPGTDPYAAVRLDEILVEDGATVAPSSLNPIDWTRLVRTCRVVVSLPTGAPAVGARVALTTTGASTGCGESLTGSDGVASLEVPLGIVQFSVTLEGYRDASVTVSGEGTSLALASVQLKSGSAVRVIVPQHRELAVHGRRVLVGINGTAASHRPSAYASETGEATLHIPGPSSATVVVEVVVPGLAAPIVADWRWVQIMEAEPVPVVEVRLDANQLRAITELIRRERAAAGLPPE